MRQLWRFLKLVVSGTVSIGVLFGCATRPATSAYLNYQTKTELLFPLTGEVLIATGGRTLELNPDHSVVPDQRFAMDIVALAPGSDAPERESLVEEALSGELPLYRGDDYHDTGSHYCFGRLIVAPGDGLVIDVRDGVRDNVPGTRNVHDIPGNFVVIDHLNGEFSMLAHFMNGSVEVEKGDRVRRGASLGKCGNSGNSNLPHLHYHLQNTPRWLDGEGLPAQFTDYYSNGVFVVRGEPVQGEIVWNGQ